MDSLLGIIYLLAVLHVPAFLVADALTARRIRNQRS